jgi:hypothetical protein
MNWSWSRFKRLLRCARAYYWRHYATHLGWESDAPPEARAAYVRSKLTPLQAEVGAVIHKRAAECVIALRDGAPMPTAKVMLARSRADLNALVLSSRRRDAFLRRPKPGFMLLEVWRDGRLALDDVDNAHDTLERCLLHLESSEVWHELRSVAPRDIMLVEKMQSFKISDSEVPVWAVPDLVYTLPDRKHWAVLDWKTGRGAGDADVAQAATYALLVRDALGRPLVDGLCECRIVDLYHGHVQAYALDEHDLADAEVVVRDSIATMRGLTADPDLNRPRPKEAYACTTQQARCRGCEYYDLCVADGSVEAGGAGEGAAERDVPGKQALAAGAGD